ncbi:MAG: hypothetical protein HHJ11_01260 [Phycicoccus sp.]|nr:hypothetical protein [Phycicoccus sp.]NMM33988.1 hypothetical protein [Phycicoccus sp.]
MTATLVYGDHVSCSRVGGGMRREASRLRQHAQSLEDAVGEQAVWKGPGVEAARRAIVASWEALRATAGVLDEAGGALQRYATDLAEGHELGRRAERRVHSAGLLLDGTRVIEPWGPASAEEAERRCSQVPVVQARVDLATAHVGRARGRLARRMASLTEALAAQALVRPPAPASVRPPATP